MPSVYPYPKVYPRAGYTCRSCNFSFKQYTPKYMQVCGIVDAEQEPYTPSQDKPADQKRKRTPRSKTMEDYRRLKSTKL